LKGKREEKLLSQQFGDAFQEHRKHTGFMFPHFS
jgi:protein-S-isoprenylcysteine O-methyltransferase Ste14